MYHGCSQRGLSPTGHHIYVPRWEGEVSHGNCEGRCRFLYAALSLRCVLFAKPLQGSYSSVPPQFVLLQYFLKASETNWGPLSLLISSGWPYQAKIFSRRRTNVSDVFDLRFSTSGHLEHASPNTSKVSPVENGPHKSTWTGLHCSEGMVVMRRGSGVVFGASAWHRINHALL